MAEAKGLLHLIKFLLQSVFCAVTPPCSYFKSLGICYFFFILPCYFSFIFVVFMLTEFVVIMVMIIIIATQW